MAPAPTTTTVKNTLALLIAASIAVAGCSTTPGPDSASRHGSHTGAAASGAASSPAGPAVAFNDADVEFVTMMYPHHAQAVEMADVVDGKSASEQVVALAAEVRAAQMPEMATFAQLLTDWGKPRPGSDGHDGHQMTGMMSPDQMDRLRALRGPEFDRAWLTMMIAHHRGAIAMADTELARGHNADAKWIAQNITTSQQAEIDRMQRILG